MPNNNPKSRDSEIVVQNLNDEVLIYDLTNHKAYTLNKMSAAVWNLCDGTNSVSEIAKALSNHLKQPVTDELVYIALDQFKEDNLLAGNEAVEIKFDGLSRRQMIKKVGLASMVALPLVVGLVAPSAAQAASEAVCNTQQSCNLDSDCPAPCTACAGVTGRCGTDFSPCANLGGACGGSGTCVNNICSNTDPFGFGGVACTTDANCLNPGTCQPELLSGRCA